MSYNPYSKHISNIPRYLDNSRALEPINNFLEHSKRRRQSLNLRLSKPTQNPQNIPLKQQLTNEQLKGMQLVLDIENQNLQRTTLDNTSQFNRLIEVSAENQISAAKSWQLETEGTLHRSVNLIDSMVPLVPVLPRFPVREIENARVSRHLYEYDHIKLKQLEQLKRIELMEQEYDRQHDLSRLTFNKYY